METYFFSLLEVLSALERENGYRWRRVETDEDLIPQLRNSTYVAADWQLIKPLRDIYSHTEHKHVDRTRTNAIITVIGINR